MSFAVSFGGCGGLQDRLEQRIRWIDTRQRLRRPEI